MLLLVFVIYTAVQVTITLTKEDICFLHTSCILIHETYCLDQWKQIVCLISNNTYFLFI
jgi:hypothetical protein